jgi:hypothetical protein
MSDRELQARFDFNESDLHSNRNGRLSQRQGEKIVTDAKKARPMSIGCGTGLLLIAAIFPIVFIPMMWETREQIIALLGIGCGVLVWVVVWGGIGVSLIRGAFKPPSLDLASVSGPVNIVGVERRTSGKNPSTYTAYELRVGDQSFDVDAELGNLIMQGEQYAIYYIRDSDKIMSLERLG